jgi:hypothetical protein
MRPRRQFPVVVAGAVAAAEFDSGVSGDDDPVEPVSVAAEAPGGVELSEAAGTVDVEAPSTAGVAEALSVVPETAGVEVELTNGGAFSM